VIPRELQSSKERRTEKLEFAKFFGSYLRKVRESKGISQENLSMNAGYYRTYVGKIEAGKYSPSLHTIWRLVHSLGMNMSEFFKGI
jgi:transcriptional regulator with XRE-family HTH domain